MANQMAEWPSHCTVEETDADGTACPTTKVMNTHGEANMDTGSRRPHGCMREPKPPSRSGQQIVFTPSAGIPGHSSGKCGPQKGGHCKEASPMFCCMMGFRSEEHTSELQSLLRISYAVLCLTKQHL